jgi:transmembrane sensor
MRTPRQPIAPEIAEAAADWIVRRDGGAFSAADERAFAQWHARPDHRDALARLEKIWGLLDEDGEQSRDAPPVAALPRQRGARAPLRTPAMGHVRKRPRRTWTAGAVAAALALFVLGSVQDWPTRLRADHMTGIGERRMVTLPDGSLVRLDSGSAIALDDTGTRRGVRLLAGAAMFDVAPDPARPFIVEADGGSVTALGTAFAIRDEDGHATVTVTRHSVRVDGDGRAVVVGEGQRADFAAKTLHGPLPARGDATAWTRGRLVVVDRPLGEVVAQIGRYRRGYVAVAGPAAAIRVSGVYDLDNPLAAIDSIEASHALSSVRLSDRFIILRR